MQEAVRLSAPALCSTHNRGSQRRQHPSRSLYECTNMKEKTLAVRSEGQTKCVVSPSAIVQFQDNSFEYERGLYPRNIRHSNLNGLEEHLQIEWSFSCFLLSISIERSCPVVMYINTTMRALQNDPCRITVRTWALFS